MQENKGLPGQWGSSEGKQWHNKQLLSIRIRNKTHRWLNPEGGKTLRVMADTYRSWRRYQKELPELIAAAEKNLLWIESALNDYRMTLLELSYKLDTVDVGDLGPVQ